MALRNTQLRPSSTSRDIYFPSIYTPTHGNIDLSFQYSKQVVGWGNRNRERCWCSWGIPKYQTAKSPNSACVPQTILKGHRISDTVFMTLIHKYVPSLSCIFFHTVLPVCHEASIWRIYSCETIPLRLARTVRNLIVKINWLYIIICNWLEVNRSTNWSNK